MSAFHSEPSLKSAVTTDFSLDLRSPHEKNMDDENALKVEINSFVWMHAPGHMTLEKADEMACKIFELFLAARSEQPTTRGQS